MRQNPKGGGFRKELHEVPHNEVHPLAVTHKIISSVLQNISINNQQPPNVEGATSPSKSRKKTAREKRNTTHTPIDARAKGRNSSDGLNE